MDFLKLPDKYTYDIQQNEDEVRVYVQEVTDETLATVCRPTCYSNSWQYLMPSVLCIMVSGRNLEVKIRS